MVTKRIRKTFTVEEEDYEAIRALAFLNRQSARAEVHNAISGYLDLIDPKTLKKAKALYAKAKEQI